MTMPATVPFQWMKQLDTSTAVTMAYVDVYLYLSKSPEADLSNIGRRAHEAVEGALLQIQAQTSAEQ